MQTHFPKFAEAEQTYEYPQTPMPYTPRTPYSALGHEMDRIPPTPGTTGGMKSPVGAANYGIYAPHAGYATDEAAKERDRGVSQYGMVPSSGVGQAVPMIMPPVTPRTKAFNALEGSGGDKPAMPGNSIRAQWGKREQGNLPWSGRNSGGRKSGGSV
jgi:hypothetical protein